jgi:hypothetical protein
MFIFTVGGILGRRPVPVPTGSHNPSAKLSTFGCYFCSPRLLLSHSPHTVGPLLFQAPFGITYLFFSLTWTSIEDLYGFLPHPISWMGNAPVSTSMYLCTIATKCQRGGHGLTAKACILRMVCITSSSLQMQQLPVPAADALNWYTDHALDA